MNLKLYFSIALLFNTFLLTNVMGQILRSPLYKALSLKGDQSLLHERIYQRDNSKELPGTLRLKLNYAGMQPVATPYAELIDRNSTFNLYKLPLDNMPCLVTNEMYNIAMTAIKQRFVIDKGLETNDYIPNFFKKQDMIPIDN